MHPVFLKIGNFVIYWYGVFVAIGVFLSIFLFQKECKKENLKDEIVNSIIFWTVLTGIIGGRILHVLVNLTYYSLNPLDILKIRNGGMAVEGAILFSLIFIIIYTKFKNISTIKILDKMAVFVPLGHSIGRIGCFLNGCCYGRETNFFLSVKFPFLEKRVHPTQLYYSFLYFVLFLILFKLSKKLRDFKGIIFSVYMISFGIIRYFVDFLRGDLKKTYLGLYSTQIIAVFIFLIGCFSLYNALFKRS